MRTSPSGFLMMIGVYAATESPYITSDPGTSSAASCAVLVEGESSTVQFGSLDKVLAEPDTQVRLFGKPTVSGQRRMAVTLARAENVNTARAKAHRAAQVMEIRL